jgi:hypothetical protein
MSEPLREDVATAIRVLADAHGATLNAVASQTALMTLGCVVADASGVGDGGAPSLDLVAGAVVALLEDAANSLAEHPQASTVPNRAAAGRAALGLEPGTHDRPLRGSRGHPGRAPTVARWLAYQSQSLFRPHQDGRTEFDTILDEITEYVVRREVAYRVNVRRQEQQAHRPPLESAMGIDWIKRFEVYYRIWLHISRTVYTLNIALERTREADRTRQECEHWARMTLYHYACVLTELESFEQEFGCLWLLPNPEAEAHVATAVWSIQVGPFEESLPLGGSILRLGIRTYSEAAQFVDATYCDAALQAMASFWEAWLSACKCAKPAKRHRQNCTVKMFTEFLALYLMEMDAQWDVLADWYGRPAVESLVGRGIIRRGAL